MNKDELQSTLAQALAEKNYEDLELLSQAAVQNFPEQAFGYAYYGEYLLATEPDSHSGLSWAFSNAAAFDDNNIEYLLKYAQVLSDAGQLDEAASTYMYILSLNAKEKEALTGMALYELSEERQNPEEAVNYLATIDEPDTQTYGFLALALYQLDELDEALASIDYVLNQDSEHRAEALELKAQILHAAQRYEEAALCYTECLAFEEQRQRADLYQALGQIYFELAAWPEAEQALNQALRIFQQQGQQELIGPSLLDASILVALERANFNYALELYQLRFAEDEASGEDKKVLARIFMGLGRSQEAIELIDELIDENTDDELNQGLCQLLKIELCLEAQNLEQALQSYEKLAGNDYFEREANWAKAQILFAQGKTEKSYPFAYKALKNNMPGASAWMKKHMSQELARRAAASYAQFQNADTAPRELLKTLFNKVWLFESASFKLPAHVQVPEEHRSFLNTMFEDGKKELLPVSLFLISEQSLLIHTNPLMDAPALQHLFAYSVAKAKENMLLLKLQSIDGQENFQLKIKVNADGSCSIAWDETLLFQIKATKLPLEDLDYKLTREFQKNMGFLNTLGLLPENESPFFKNTLEELFVL